MTYLEGMQERYAVIALGGNAILQKGQSAEPAVQMDNLRKAVDRLVVAGQRYNSFALTHGNGPQVGNDMIRSHCAFENQGIPELGLTDCVANTQGRIGHWLIREMKNHPRFREYPVACVLTHVYVDKIEFTESEYTKYIGPWRPNDELTRKYMDSQGIRYKSPDGSPDKIRRVVPSPNPYAIEEFGTIAHLLENGVITICCGGGGVPVFDQFRDSAKDQVIGDSFQQSDVVIDKDRASALLASNLITYFGDVEIELVILMDNRGLFADSRFRDEDFIPKMSMVELKDFIAENNLDPGSIRPKLESILYFLEHGGRRAFLGPLDNFPEVFNPDSGIGTVFYQSPQLGLYE